MLSGGKGAVMEGSDPMAAQRLIVAVDLDGDGREARIRMAARLGLQEGICNHFSALVPGHDGLMLVNQLRLEERDDTGFSSKLVVSVVGDLLGPAKLELGVIGPLSGQGEQAIKIGTWFEF